MFRSIIAGVLSLRSVAQPGRALRSGRRGRWFEPSHSDHKFKPPKVAVLIYAWGCNGLEHTLCNNVVVRQRVDFASIVQQNRYECPAGTSCRGTPETKTIILTAVCAVLFYLLFMGMFSGIIYIIKRVSYE